MGCAASKQESVLAHAINLKKRPIVLISKDALAVKTSDFHILDCSLVMDKSFDPIERHQATHIPGAHFLALSDLCDKSSPYFLMMPTKD